MCTPSKRFPVALKSAPRADNVTGLDRGLFDMRELGRFPERKLKRVQHEFNEPLVGSARRSAVGNSADAVRSLGCTPGSGLRYFRLGASAGGHALFANGRISNRPE